MKDKDNKRVRVRFAPSPTGLLHIGGVRTALYNYLFAKKHGGNFILRLEDTDQKRFVELAEFYIRESLAWLGIKIDEGVGAFSGKGNYGPYYQSERTSLYLKFVNKLLDNGDAYYAFDTAEELENMRKYLREDGVKSPKYNHIMRKHMMNSLNMSPEDVKDRIENGEPYVIRFKIPEGEKIVFDDAIRGTVSFNSSELDDKILMKSDGMPTYHLANVVDDCLMKITHVIRGEEWLSSTPLHILLYEKLGWKKAMPEFVHLPLILGPDGKKLSKRDGAKYGIPTVPVEGIDESTGEALMNFRDEGYFPETVINFLALLGWNPGMGDEEEIFTMKELIKRFSFNGISKSGAKFSIDKAKWINQCYIKSMDDKKLAIELKKILDEKNVKAKKSYVISVCSILKSRVSFVKDFWEIGSYFFVAPDSYDKKLYKKYWKDDSESKLINIINQLSDMTRWTENTIKKACGEAVGEDKLNKTLGVLRLVLTNYKFGPPVFEIAEMLGKEETILRIKNSLKNRT